MMPAQPFADARSDPRSFGPDRSLPPVGHGPRPSLLEPSPSQLEPPPPPPGRALRALARVLLWTLIAVAALRGVLPTSAVPEWSGLSGVPAPSATDAGKSGPQASAQSQLSMAIAAAFLREYLMVDDGRRAERSGRLKRYLARGVDLVDGVIPAPGTSQSADLVLPVGVRPVKGGMEVTVLAHLLRTRDGQALDGGTVAFSIPMVAGSAGMAVGGIPRPVVLPVDPSPASGPVALPAALAQSAAATAGQAVAAVLNGDRAALVRLGGGAAPVVLPFPDGWRPVGIAGTRPAGPPATPTVQVLVRARPSVAGIEYLVPVRVSLRPRAGTLTVREIDAGGRP